jgi:tetratricopeptide (TPR) repeat protein
MSVRNSDDESKRSSDDAHPDQTKASKPTRTDADSIHRKHRRSVIRLWIILVITAAIASSALGLAYIGYSRRKIAALNIDTKTAYELATKETGGAREWEQVERAALDWFQWEPENAKPLLYAAEAASRQNAINRKALYLFKLPDEDPQSVVGLLELSDMQFRMLNDPIACEDTCHRILRIDSKNGEAFLRLGFYYAMSRQRSQLVDIARRAIQRGGDTPATYLYLMGADWLVFSNGHEFNTQWLQSNPRNEIFQVAAAIHFTSTAALSEASLGESGRKQTEQVMQELLDRFPKNLEALALHLNAACYRGQVDRVITLLEQAPTGSAKDSRFWTFKGWVHEQRDEFDEAEESYLNAIKLYPYDEKAYHWLAGVYRQTNELKKSERYEQISVIGTEIKREALQLSDTLSLPPDLMRKMVKFAAAVGDAQVAKGLQQRLAESPP